MYNSKYKNQNISVKTDYNKRRRNKLIKSRNKRNNNNYNQIDYNKFEGNEKRYLNEIGTWNNHLDMPSKEKYNQFSSNFKSYHNKMIPLNINNNYGEKRHFKESNYYDYTTKTQIVHLPGCIKRNKYDIKDDYYFQKPYNYSRLFKLVYDYNSNINYEKNYSPITQGYNINSFPTKERYYGSYKRGVEDHDIFNLKFYKKYKHLYDF